jgi:hypothetical protein
MSHDARSGVDHRVHAASSSSPAPLASPRRLRAPQPTRARTRVARRHLRPRPSRQSWFRGARSGRFDPARTRACRFLPYGHPHRLWRRADGSLAAAPLIARVRRCHAAWACNAASAARVHPVRTQPRSPNAQPCFSPSAPPPRAHHALCARPQVPGMDLSDGGPEGSRPVSISLGGGPVQRGYPCFRHSCRWSAGRSEPLGMLSAASSNADVRRSLTDRSVASD